MTSSKTTPARPQEPATYADTVPEEKKPALAATTLRALRARSAPAAPTVPAESATPAKTTPPETTTPDETPQSVENADTVENAETVETVEPTPAESVTTADADADPEAPPALPTKRRTATNASAKSSGARTAAKAAPPARRRPGALVVTCAALAVAALVFAVVAGVVWWRAGHSAERTAALTRDRVVVDARLAIATVNTADYREPQAALDNWLAASTGSLHSQFADSRKSATSLLAQAKMITSATVLDAAVTSLDTGKGTASLIASVNVVRKPTTGAATTTRNRFRASMKLVGGQWKLADLSIVSVQLT